MIKILYYMDYIIFLPENGSKKIIQILQTKEILLLVMPLLSEFIISNILIISWEQINLIRVIFRLELLSEFYLAMNLMKIFILMKFKFLKKLKLFWIHVFSECREKIIGNSISTKDLVRHRRPIFLFLLLCGISVTGSSPFY